MVLSQARRNSIPQTEVWVKLPTALAETLRLLSNSDHFPAYLHLYLSNDHAVLPCATARSCSPRPSYSHNRRRPACRRPCGLGQETTFKAERWLKTRDCGTLTSPNERMIKIN